MSSTGPASLATVLTIAGSDSGGGAGIQLDLQVFRYFGLHGASVLTALTAQDTREVRRVHHLPPQFVADQLDTVARDLHPAAAKTGMLGRPQVVTVVADRVRRREIPRLVVDPVVAAKDGTPLLAARGLETLRRELLPRTAIVTPNLPEAELLTGISIQDAASLDAASGALLAMGVGAVLVKGGHRPDAPVDTLWHAGKRYEFSSERIPGTPVHGTGCLYSAALAARLALGDPVPEACAGVKRWMARVIADAVRVGRGNRVADLSRIPSWDEIQRNA